MRVVRVTGRNAAVIKYDLLTALGAHGCAADKHLQRQILRFMTLIVARYNWQHNELAVGQREIAALWAVDERTVKRDMAKLRAMGWLVQLRPAARGRVAVHALDLPVILAATRLVWERVGSDFVERMAAPQSPEPGGGTVVPFPGVALPEKSGLWPRILAVLTGENAALAAAWFAPLLYRPGAEGDLTLRAPSRFHATYVQTHHLARLQAAAFAVDPYIRSVFVTE